MIHHQWAMNHRGPFMIHHRGPFMMNRHGPFMIHHHGPFMMNPHGPFMMNRHGPFMMNHRGPFMMNPHGPFMIVHGGAWLIMGHEPEAPTAHTCHGIYRRTCGAHRLMPYVHVYTYLRRAHTCICICMYGHTCVRLRAPCASVCVSARGRPGRPGRPAGERNEGACPDADKSAGAAASDPSLRGAAPAVITAGAGCGPPGSASKAGSGAARDSDTGSLPGRGRRAAAPASPDRRAASFVGLSMADLYAGHALPPGPPRLKLEPATPSRARPVTESVPPALRHAQTATRTACRAGLPGGPGSSWSRPA
jgi:hypothetical protein